MKKMEKWNMFWRMNSTPSLLPFCLFYKTFNFCIKTWDIVVKYRKTYKKTSFVPWPVGIPYGVVINVLRWDRKENPSSCITGEAHSFNLVSAVKEVCWELKELLSRRDLGVCFLPAELKLFVLVITDFRVIANYGSIPSLIDWLNIFILEIISHLIGDINNTSWEY